MTRELQYALMDPTKNVTILLETPVPEEQQAFVAAKLLELEPTAEQVGFLSRSDRCDIALRMAGGEFCGNATMSAAVLAGMHTGMRQGQVTVSVSGVPDPVSVRITAGQNGLWQGTVDMPRPVSIERISFPEGHTYPVVSFRGISHVILERALSQNEAENLVKHWCKYLNADALGLMFLDRNAGRLTPLVYVPAADTLFWESACGSGTAAVGAWLARASAEPITAALQQPGGILEVSASPDGPILLKGTVACVCEKTAVISW